MGAWPCGGGSCGGREGESERREPGPHMNELGGVLEPAVRELESDSWELVSDMGESGGRMNESSSLLGESMIGEGGRVIVDSRA